MIPFPKEVTLNNLRKSREMTNKKSRLQLYRKRQKEEGVWEKQTGVFKSGTHQGASPVVQW